jgi:hypothetical protein
MKNIHILPKEEIQPQQIWNEEKMEGVKKLIQEQKILEEVAERLYPGVDRQIDRMLFINGAKWQQEQDKKLYSEEEVYGMLQKLRLGFKVGVQKWQENFEFDLEEWFEQFKKK